MIFETMLVVAGGKWLWNKIHESETAERSTDIVRSQLVLLDESSTWLQFVPDVVPMPTMKPIALLAKLAKDDRIGVDSDGNVNVELLLGVLSKAGLGMAIQTHLPLLSADDVVAIVEGFAGPLDEEALGRFALALIELTGVDRDFVCATVVHLVGPLVWTTES